MAIHLPFIGYFLGRGAQGPRLDRNAPLNRQAERRIKDFFTALDRVPVENFGPLLISDKKLPRQRRFEEVLFETDEEHRPELKRFVAMPRPKSLVVLTKQDLFQGTHSFNKTVSDFALNAVETYIPILCIDDDRFPLSPSLVYAAGAGLPFRLSDNQCGFEEYIKHRFAQKSVR